MSVRSFLLGLIVGGLLAGASISHFMADHLAKSIESTSATWQQVAESWQQRAQSCEAHHAGGKDRSVKQ